MGNTLGHTNDIIIIDNIIKKDLSYKFAPFYVKFAFFHLPSLVVETQMDNWLILLFAANSYLCKLLQILHRLIILIFCETWQLTWMDQVRKNK